jgi:hypothetical protein
VAHDEACRGRLVAAVNVQFPVGGFVMSGMRAGG